MSEALTNIQGRASIAGTPIFTVPANTTVTIVGLRVANNDATARHWFHVTHNGFFITGAQTRLAVGGAMEAVQGSKVVAKAGDVIMAYGDTDDQVDITLSYLEQVA